ncbi:hypothetical protein GVV04_31625 [Micromonospora sp. NEAU-HG-1]|nr:hypothetical protein [Micromonospora rubida]
MDVLLSGGNETPYFRDARLPMLRDLVAQRAACASIPALLSSAVEIYPHQVRTALTVLSDPVPRYLLADEVGLGKTIEAGLVIRQVLIDDPTARIAVLVPGPLRHQWAHELLERFFTDDFPEATLKIISHEAPERWNSFKGFDLVVVDEAHRLVDVDDQAMSPYAELSALARSTHRLLLLSATPILWHEATHLGLLHLLDPDVYRWEDRAGFTERLRTRMDLATAAYSMDATFEQFLPSAIDEVTALIPADPRFRTLADEVLAMLNDQDDLRNPSMRPELAARVDALRAHLGETYRLHRRVIRHRRHTVLREDTDASTLPFAVTGRVKPTVVPLNDAASELGHDLVLAWQSHVSRWLRDTDDLSHAGAYGLALAVLASRAGGNLEDLLDALRWRWHHDGDAAVRAALTAYEREILRAVPIAPGESDLSEMVTDSDDDLDAMVRAVLDTYSTHVRVVAFCGAGQLASRLAGEIRHHKSVIVAEHTTVVGGEASQTSVREWSAKGGVLICDESAEDGLNLQIAEAIVHCRLPWSPNRLEQRLGRVDRYHNMTISGPARQIVLSSPAGDYSFAGAWASVLETGFTVFGKSISALQAGVERVLPALWREGLIDGPQAILRQARTVHEALVREQKDVDTIDSLEAIYETDTGLRDIAEAVGAVELDWRKMQEAICGYAGDGNGGLRLSVRRSSSPREPLVHFGLGAAAPLMPPRLFARARHVSEPMMAGVFNRTVALRMPGTRLFRVGSPLVDLLANVVNIDDRGQASAFWRRGHGDPQVFFGFDYLVEAETASAEKALEASKQVARALRRQADRLLEPFMRRVWIRVAAASAVSEQGLLALLERPYDPRRGDINLNTDRIKLLLDLFGDRQKFTDASYEADAAARAHLARSTDLVERCAAAREQAMRVLAVSRAQALARHAAGRLLGDTESFLADVKVEEHLVSSLADPRVSLVSVTCCVVGDLSQGAR